MPIENEMVKLYNMSALIATQIRHVAPKKARMLANIKAIQAVSQLMTIMIDQTSDHRRCLPALLPIIDDHGRY